MEVSKELLDYVASAKKAGIASDVIRTGLLKAGWESVAIDSALSPISAQTIPASSFQAPIPPKTTYSSSATISSSPLNNFSNQNIEKKHLRWSIALAPIVVFILSFSFFVYAGYKTKDISMPLLIGGGIISLAITAIFSVIALLIRKISRRFGKKWQFILWPIIVVILCIVTWSFFLKNYFTPSYIYTTPGTIVVSKDKLTIDECINTTDEMLKRACGLNLAMEKQDRQMCLTIFGHSEYGYYCQFLYDGQFPDDHFPTISECTDMVVSPEGSSFYKDMCFRWLAQIKFDKNICKNIIDTSRSYDSCVKGIDANIYNRDNLCPSLFKNNVIPNSNECHEYVYSLNDPVMCKKIGVPQWSVDKCLELAK